MQRNEDSRDVKAEDRQGFSGLLAPQTQERYAFCNGVTRGAGVRYAVPRGPRCYRATRRGAQREVVGIHHGMSVDSPDTTGASDLAS